MKSAARFHVLLPLLIFCFPASAAESGAPVVRGLAVIDWIIIGIYAASTIFLGWWFGRKQQSTKEYFVGSGKMNPLLIGVSLFASLLSTITYLSIPGETQGKGPVYLTNLIAYPIIFLIIGYVLLPVYMRQRVTSAYELLEERLGVSIRILGASLFLALRLVWMSLLIYLTAKALATMIGAGDGSIKWIVLCTGLVAVTYASIGGLRAVVITDLLQTILLYGGALLVIATITVKMNGFSWFPNEWVSTWDTQPFFSLDPGTRVTVFGTVLSVLIWYTCTSGGDQVSIQRFMATRDARTARRAIGMQLIVAAIVGVTLGLAGFALLGYFQANPNLLPPDLAGKAGADKVFPHYIAFHLPPIVSGLVVSGLFAAAMSSIDSGVNSITAVVTSDFIDRFRRRPISEERHVLIARIIAFTVGAIVVAGSSFIDRVPGNITAVANKTVNLLTVPIFCLFFFALFVKFARPAAVWVAAIITVSVAASIAFSGPLVHLLHDWYGVDPTIFGTELVTWIDPETGVRTVSVPDPISFQWIGPVALVVNISVGCLLSLLFRQRPAEE